MPQIFCIFPLSKLNFADEEMDFLFLSILQIKGYFTKQNSSASSSAVDLSYRSQRLSQSPIKSQQQCQLENPQEESGTFNFYTLSKLLIWLLLWGVFIHLGFGAVFLVVSALIFIYFSTRKNPNQDGKLSAYSVFNPNFERLDGTLTGEQFEKELRFGPGAVH